MACKLILVAITELLPKFISKKLLKILFLLSNHNLLLLISAKIPIFIAKNKNEKNPHFRFNTNIQYLTVNTTVLDNYNDFLFIIILDKHKRPITVSLNADDLAPTSHFLHSNGE